MVPVPVKQTALELGCPVLEPPNMKAESFLSKVRELSPDILVVVAFRILPRVLFEMIPYGAVNVHPSLLPKYRGAAPIPWTLIHGETETGVTTFRIAQAVDTGNILLVRKVSIDKDDDAGVLHDTLADIGADLLIETLDGLKQGTLAGQPQDDSLATPAPKIQHSDTAIDWRESAENIRNRVRAFSPFPGAWTTIQGKTFKIYKCDVMAGETEPQAMSGHEEIPGMVAPNLVDGCPSVRTGDGWLTLLDVQIQGKRRMPVGDFLRGFSLEGVIFETPEVRNE
jgi:methionyl-tRNA formyltransferase